MKHCIVIKDQRLCMQEVSKVVFVTFTPHCIQSNVTHVRGIKTAYRVPQYRAMLLMSEVSKVHTGLSIQFNVAHIKGVKSSSISSYSSLLITFLLFNQFSIQKKFWKAETFKYCLCWRC